MINATTAAARRTRAAGPSACDRCSGIGLRISPQGRVEVCPTLQMGLPHAELTAGGKIINRAVAGLWRRKIKVDLVYFDIARLLSQFTAERPCSRTELVERHFAYIGGINAAENQRRAVTLAIRFLREIWLLPVCASKRGGYWIATDALDFGEWVNHAKSEPLTTLSTIYRLAKANFPVFAEQLEIEFWQDFGPQDSDKSEF